MRDHLIAVDVGTGSARAGVVTRTGRLLARREHPILLSRPSDERGEHNSQDIWEACCIAVKAALAEAGIGPAAIAGIGFDATCSLVLLDSSGQPLCLNGEDGFDTISWLDHRATAEAEECGTLDHPVLHHNGRVISPEAEIPKLMWLKRHRPDLWQRLGLAFDLADFLTWKATGNPARSLCTLTSKWTFFGHSKPGWQQDFLDRIGLDDLVARAGLPQEAVAVGKRVGTLSTDAADALGLIPGTPVAAGMVDAYAGALGVLGSTDLSDPDLNHVAMIGGTSSCLIALRPQPLYGFSLWGPYFGAIFPDLWLVEAGQSATGALLNHLVRSHAEGGEPSIDNHRRIIARIAELRAEEGASFGQKINVLPDFHGNRSPFADPNLTGTISGLTLDASFDGLCRLYWRACVGIVLGLRQIVETLGKDGIGPLRLHLTGGHVKNPLLVELYAEATGCELVVADGTDAVLIGTAINAASAAGLYPGLAEAGAAMAEPGRLVVPNRDMKSIYDRDYARFLAMQRHRAELDAI
ncbi:FGGY-family carbohydrate kinase [Agrobacterium vitis]|uniref:FGGY-family carbohydrate kinase n=1 Tax=Agrobacterium vitis TaxID=373 RepID=UPI001571D254|nr:FGGY-family carbohydrate kinase [Agrobacterium vitis]NSZ53901.1 FGGY-family carbohydrate kinase [Agrobacterium vitis]NTA32659.1 FGGY-family carbohydrate kinase [Agrobacterium vitis]